MTNKQYAVFVVLTAAAGAFVTWLVFHALTN